MRILLAPCLVFMIACWLFGREQQRRRSPRGFRGRRWWSHQSPVAPRDRAGPRCREAPSGSGGASASSGARRRRLDGRQQQRPSGRERWCGCAGGSGAGTPEDPNATGRLGQRDARQATTGTTVSDTSWPISKMPVTFRFQVALVARGSRSHMDERGRRSATPAGDYNIAIANDKPGPPTLWVDIGNDGLLGKSTDGGATWANVGSTGIGAALYSMVADPYSPAHVIRAHTNPRSSSNRPTEVRPSAR